MSDDIGKAAENMKRAVVSRLRDEVVESQQAEIARLKARVAELEAALTADLWTAAHAMTALLAAPKGVIPPAAAGFYDGRLGIFAPPRSPALTAQEAGE